MKAIIHCERKALAAPCEDRFVLAPASKAPNGVSLFDQPASAVLRRAPPKHPNAEIVQGLSAHVLREHYRASFGKDPGTHWQHAHCARRVALVCVFVFVIVFVIAISC